MIFFAALVHLILLALLAVEAAEGPGEAGEEGAGGAPPPTGTNVDAVELQSVGRSVELE
jgi:hypothetical protein